MESIKRYGWGRRLPVAVASAGTGAAAVVWLAPGGTLGTNEPVHVTAGLSARAYRALTGSVADGPAWAQTALEAASEGTLLFLGLLLVWVSATETEQITTLYAQAAHRRGPGPGCRERRAGVPGLARHDPPPLAGDPRRPHRPPRRGPLVAAPSLTGNGWVLATTRLREARLSGAGRVVIPVDTYTEEEAAAYLRDCLTSAETMHLIDDHAAELAAALGHLPLALHHAAAYMINEDVNCSQYLQLFNDSTARLDDPE